MMVLSQFLLWKRPRYDYSSVLHLANAALKEVDLNSEVRHKSQHEHEGNGKTFDGVHYLGCLWVCLGAFVELRCLSELLVLWQVSVGKRDQRFLQGSVVVQVATLVGGLRRGWNYVRGAEACRRAQRLVGTVGEGSGTLVLKVVYLVYVSSRQWSGVPSRASRTHSLHHAVGRVSSLALLLHLHHGGCCSLLASCIFLHLLFPYLLCFC